MILRSPALFIAFFTILHSSLASFAQEQAPVSTPPPGPDIPAPKTLADYFTTNVPVRGTLVRVLPPEEIGKYLEKVEKARLKDPQWFFEYSKKSPPSIPLPFHEKLGLTKKEYDEYIKLWESRKMTPIPNGEVLLRLEATKEGTFRIRALGPAAELTTKMYDPKEDTFSSVSGTLERIEDVKTVKQSLLGAWTGREWRLEGNDGFGITKENIAIGKLEEEGFGVIVYRVQELNSSGAPIFDKSMIIRFVIPSS